ncbi:MAG: OsmC family peroxiredoxin [Chloroflexi bacterium]|nr:OsmC family peroxiredoxin [Chloroflexota bacterium]MCL5110266.1 OsmC family peroxiredoxin [Chloroflexota bacterium]MDA8216096.1 OsmC family peroxiredoxin [Dehalococcoidales bacterium]
MPLTQRRAEVTWEGNLIHGNGKVTTGTGVLKEAPVTWAARTERPDGKTSPEELIAAAHAACYAMAFSNTMDKAGHAPTRLHINAVCSLERVEGGIKISAMDLNVSGVVPGLDQAEFARLAEAGEKGCPVSNALRNNVEIRVQAKLENA